LNGLISEPYRFGCYGETFSASNKALAGSG